MVLNLLEDMYDSVLYKGHKKTIDRSSYFSGFFAIVEEKLIEKSSKDRDDG